MPTAGRTIVPARVVTVTGRPHPFKVDRFEPLRLPEGLTVAEMVELAIPAEFRSIARVFLDDAREPLHREHLHRIRPKPGTFVRIVPVPEAGADVLRTVLMVGVLVAAAGLTVATGGVAGAMLGSVIVAGGMLGVNALVPPEPPTVAKGQPSPGQTFSVEGARNRADLRGPVPWILGRVRHYPRLAAQQVSEISGDDVYLRMLVTWGYADLQVDPLQIGETPVDQLTDVQTETLQAAPGQVSDHTLYSSSASMAQVGAGLTKAADWVTHDTGLAVDRSIVNVLCQKGLIQFGHNTGDKLGVEVEFEYRYRIKDTGAWSNTFQASIRGKTISTTRRAIVVDYPQRGQQWELSVRRTTDDHQDSDHIFDDTSWETISSYTWENPVRLGGLATTALYGKAGEQFSGVVDELNAVVTREALDWDRGSGAWVKRATRNPASMFRYLLQGPGTKKPRPDSRLVLPDIQDWHEWCTDNGYTCDLELASRTSLEEALRTVAATGRATLIRPDGKYSVAIDRTKPLVTIYAPNNSNNIRTHRTFLDVPHALYVEFPNEDKGYASDFRYVFNDGYDETNATKILPWQFPGVTNSDLVWKHGRKRLAELIHRQLRHEIDIDLEALAVRVGDRVGLANDVILTGLGWGRVTALDVNAGVLSRVQLDEAPALPGGSDTVIRVRDLDGTINVWAVQPFAGRDRWLTLADVVAAADAPEFGAIVVAGYRGREVAECLVREVRPGPGSLTCTLALVPAADAIQLAELGDIPPFDSGITAPPGGNVPIITSVRSDASVLQRDADGSFHLQMLVALYHDGRRALSRLDQVEVQWEEEDSGGGRRSVFAGPDATELRIPSVEVGAAYLVRARYRFRAEGDRPARYGAWSPYVEHALVGPDLVPPDVGKPYLAGDRIEWTYDAAPPDLVGYVVRVSTVSGQRWEDAQPLTEGFATAAFVLLAELPDAAAEVLVKAINTAGLESLNAVRLPVAGVPRPKAVEIFAEDLAAEGFPGDTVSLTAVELGVLLLGDGTDGRLLLGDALGGYLVADEAGVATAGGAAVQGAALVAVDTSAWLEPATGAWLEPPDAPWLASQSDSFTYVARFTCPNTTRPGDRVRLDWAFTGAVEARYRWASADLTRVGRDTPLPARTEPLPPRWVPLGALLSGASSTNPFRPWVQGVRADPGQVLEMEFFGRGGPGVARPSITRLRVTVEADLATLTAPEVAVQAGGTRIALPAGFRTCAFVTVTARQPSAAVTYGYLDLSDPAGPVVVGYDGQGNGVGFVATVTAGYA